MKSLLDGLTYPSVSLASPPALKAYISPPVYDDMYVHPIAYIWGGRLVYDRLSTSGARNTSPGSGALRKLTWQVDIYIKAAVPNTTSGSDNDFPLLVDAVISKLAGTPLNQPITDATTGIASTVSLSGEHMELAYGNLHAARDQRLWIAEARITNTVMELIQQ